MVGIAAGGLVSGRWLDWNSLRSAIRSIFLDSSPIALQMVREQVSEEEIQEVLRRLKGMDAIPDSIDLATLKEVTRNDDNKDTTV